MSKVPTKIRGARGAPIGLVIVLLATLAIPSFAGHGVAVGVSGSNFEIRDGNTSPGAGHLDWDSPVTGDPNATPPTSGTTTTITVKTDQATGSGDDSYSGGAKEDSANAAVGTGSIPPNKSDLKELGYYVESNAFLHVFWSRVQDPSGTTNMDFEFNKNACVVGGANNVCSGNGVTPTRVAGDLLISYDLSKGGSVPTIWTRTWDGSMWGTATELTAGSDAAGSINTAEITSTKTGNTYSPRTFGEATIKLSAIFSSTGPCRSFGSAHLNSRSSDSFTSAMKDFIAPVPVSVTNCARVIIDKTDGSNPLAGASFTIRLTTPSTSTPVAVTPIVATGAAANTATRFCVDGLERQTNYTLIETAPTGYDPPDPAPTVTTSNTAETCSGVTTSSPTAPTITVVNVRQAGSVTVSKVDDAGTAMGGVTFTLWTNAAPTTGTRGGDDATTTMACTTASATTSETTLGVCRIDNVPLGEYWLVETVPSGYDGAGDQNVSITTGGQNVTKSLTNHRLFKVIVLVCRKSTDALYQSNVSFDGGSTTVPSLGSGTTLPGSLTQAQLCGLGGAVHDNVRRQDSTTVGTTTTLTNHSAGIGIPATP